MRRTFKQFAVNAGGTPQPLVGTVVSATTAPGPATGDGTTSTNVPVADSSMFTKGDWAYFVTTTYTLPEKVLVTAVPDSTHITVKNLQNTRTGGAFGTGDFVSVGIEINTAYVQTVAGNAGLIYLGTQGLNKTGLVHVIATLFNVATGQPTDFTIAPHWGPNTFGLSDLWLDGTTADKYQPSVDAV
jgi:hypothetical protein